MSLTLSTSCKLACLLVLSACAVAQIVNPSSGGSVTHTTGNLTAGACVIGNGAKDIKVDPNCTLDGSGNLAIVSEKVGVGTPNEAGTGTTVNKLAKFTGSNTLTLATTADTAIPVFIVTSGAGKTGNAFVATSGVANCVFDGATTANDFVIASVTSNGECHDDGATAPTSGWVIGQVLSTNGGGGTYSVALSQGYNAAAASVKTGSVDGFGFYDTTTTVSSTAAPIAQGQAPAFIGTSPALAFLAGAGINFRYWYAYSDATGSSGQLAIAPSYVGVSSSLLCTSAADQNPTTTERPLLKCVPATANSRNSVAAPGITWRLDKSLYATSYAKFDDNSSGTANSRSCPLMMTSNIAVCDSDDQGASMSYVGFSYSSVRDAASAFYQCVAANGTAQDVTPSAVGIDTAAHTFELIFNAAGTDVTYKIDGATQCAGHVTTHFPASTTLMRAYSGFDPTTSSTHNWYFGYLAVTSKMK